jgi:2-keto-4-pentenoate hydratase/2-oxohepta-3-ene-1,7-dioic acid hydratase in catechol pathway
MKIICVGRNYSEHIAELNNEIPENMVLFMKPSTALLHHKNDLFLPDFSDNVHYECEIVLKICKNGKFIQEKFAENYFEELTLGLDLTARDIQDQLKAKGLPWERAKSFDNSAVVGTFVNKKTLPNPNEIQFSLELNNEIVQQGNSHNMIYSFEKIISEVSKYFTLQVGDLIFTGTPKGVGKINPMDTLTGILEDQKVFSVQIK